MEKKKKITIEINDNSHLKGLDLEEKLAELMFKFQVIQNKIDVGDVKPLNHTPSLEPFRLYGVKIVLFLCK